MMLKTKMPALAIANVGTLAAPSGTLTGGGYGVQFRIIPGFAHK